MIVKAAWAIAALAILIGVYYLIPNIYHVLAARPMEHQIKHALAFFGLAIVIALVLVGGRLVRGRVPERV